MTKVPCSCCNGEHVMTDRKKLTWEEAREIASDALMVQQGSMYDAMELVKDFGLTPQEVNMVATEIENLVIVERY